MNWLEMFAIFVISILGYLFITWLVGVMIVDAVKDYNALPWGAWATGAFIFVVVVLAWAYGLSFPLKW